MYLGRKQGCVNFPFFAIEASGIRRPEILYKDRDEDDLTSN